ncbi:MAG: patatin-like phospholipase family protein [Rhodospirillales bacterium]|nr:patatin-like phospholipase family protein [Rhodospirillales bacterium]
MSRVLGVRLPQAKPPVPPPRPVRAAPAQPLNPAPRHPDLRPHPRSGAPIRPAVPTGTPETYPGAHGRRLEITHDASGRVVLAAPPPPVREITFSGGGGKGAALPGAVRALENSGVLKDVRTVTGASVGSMTAAMVAAGMTGAEFAAIGNDPTVAGKITQGKNMAEVLFGGGLDGEGLEGLVRANLDATLRKRISEYLERQSAMGKPGDPTVLAILDRLADGSKGPTFADLAALSKIIPAVKEVVISGSFMSQIDPKTGKPIKGTEAPQLMVFSASTTPDLEVALAVHASAALPPVFKPVDIPLPSGITARFQDGGVMNNAPTLESIGAERELDPMPDKSEMTFVFEEPASHDILKGKASPDFSRFDRFTTTVFGKKLKVGDMLTKADLEADDYAKNRGLADAPQDVVMVPLTFTTPPKRKGGKGEKKDFTGFFSGTVNFGMDAADKITLQDLADKATLANIAQRRLPKTHQFASDGQMLMAIDAGDLAALAKDDYPGAAEAEKFRKLVGAAAGRLAARVAALAGGTAAALASDKDVVALLAALDKAAGGDADRQGYVGRALNRSGKLDPLMDALRRGGKAQAGVAAACVAVNEEVMAQDHARTILRDVVYPELVNVDPKGPDGAVLAEMDDKLRHVTSPADVNAALHIGIAHFSHRRDPLGIRGWKKFAQSLEPYRMAVP